MDIFAQVSAHPWTRIYSAHDKFIQCLRDLKSCKQSNIPIYSFSEHQRLDDTQYVYGAAIIIGTVNLSSIYPYCLPCFLQPKALWHCKILNFGNYTTSRYGLVKTVLQWWILLVFQLGLCPMWLRFDARTSNWQRCEGTREGCRWNPRAIFAICQTFLW
jgi:hypothetical protein